MIYIILDEAKVKCLFLFGGGKKKLKNYSKVGSFAKETIENLIFETHVSGK